MNFSACFNELLTSNALSRDCYQLSIDLTTAQLHNYTDEEWSEHWSDEDWYNRPGTVPQSDYYGTCDCLVSMIDAVSGIPSGDYICNNCQCFDAPVRACYSICDPSWKHQTLEDPKNEYCTAIDTSVSPVIWDCSQSSEICDPTNSEPTEDEIDLAEYIELCQQWTIQFSDQLFTCDPVPMKPTTSRPSITPTLSPIIHPSLSPTETPTLKPTDSISTIDEEIMTTTTTTTTTEIDMSMPKTTKMTTVQTTQSQNNNNNDDEQMNDPPSRSAADSPTVTSTTFLPSIQTTTTSTTTTTTMKPTVRPTTYHPTKPQNNGDNGDSNNNNDGKSSDDGSSNGDDNDDQNGIGNGDYYPDTTQDTDTPLTSDTSGGNPVTTALVLLFIFSIVCIVVYYTRNQSAKQDRDDDDDESEIEGGQRDEEDDDQRGNGIHRETRGQSHMSGKHNSNHSKRKKKKKKKRKHNKQKGSLIGQDSDDSLSDSLSGVDTMHHTEIELGDSVIIQADSPTTTSHMIESKMNQFLDEGDHISSNDRNNLHSTGMTDTITNDGGASGSDFGFADDSSDNEDDGSTVKVGGGGSTISTAIDSPPAAASSKASDMNEDARRALEQLEASLDTKTDRKSRKSMKSSRKNRKKRKSSSDGGSVISKLQNKSSKHMKLRQDDSSDMDMDLSSASDYEAKPITVVWDKQKIASHHFPSWLGQS